MKISFRSVVCLAVLTYFTSCKCSKKIDCPGYVGTNVKEWFNYQDKQVLVFSTTSGEQATFNLRNTLTTEPYEATGALGSTPSCSADQTFESTEKDTSFRPAFSANFSENESNSRGYLYISRTSIEVNGITTDSINQIYIGYYHAPLQHVNSVVIGNKTFSNVYMAQVDTTDKKQAGIYKVYIGRNQGLVGYAEYPSLKVWAKQ